MVCKNTFKYNFVLLLCPLISTSCIKEQTPKMVIDHDGGADDAMAILAALLYEKDFHGPKIVALTTVHGNGNESQAYINTQRILNTAGRLDVPIYRGSSEALVNDYPSDQYFGNDSLGDLQNISYRAVEAESLHAVQALIELSKKYQDELIIVTLGTLTNIATAIKLDPGIVKRTKHIYVGAGNVYDKNFPLSTESEFNVLLDVEAYHILAQHATADKVTVVPFSQIRKDFKISTAWRKNVLGSIPTKIMTSLNGFERVNIPKNQMWQLLDPAVMAIVLENRIIADVRLTENSVVLCGDGDGPNRRGVTTNNFNSTDENMKLVYSVYVDTYKAFLIRVFSENSPDRPSD